MNNYERFAKPESTVAPGWKQWHTVLSEAQYYDYDLFVNGRTMHYGRAPKDNLTTVLNHDAVRMVNRYAPKRKPFYLQLDERSPHVITSSTRTAHAGTRPSPSRRTRDASRTRCRSRPRSTRGT